MKELKQLIWNDINKGFDEINQLLNAYKFSLESLVGKSKDEQLEEFIDNQMSILRSICDSHLSKIQNNLIKQILDLKNKKEMEK